MSAENTSRVAGYLTPVGTPPSYDDGLEDILQQYVAGISGIDGTLVRPRWQPEPPKQPESGETWAAFGIMDIEATPWPVITHSGTDATDDDDGSDTLAHHESITLLVSFYGPQAMAACRRFADGVLMPQNNDMLRQYGMALVSVDGMASMPVLEQTRWEKRYDIHLHIGRKVSRTYQVRNIADAPFAVSGKV